jgi:hypothetical protein
LAIAASPVRKIPLSAGLADLSTVAKR